MSYSLRSTYVENEVLNASPERLVQILYELAIKSLSTARDSLREKNIPERVRQVNKTFAVLSELQSGLDFEAGGEIAANYGRIYDYCQRRLIEANILQSDEILAEIQSLFSDLNEAWAVVVAKTSSERREVLYSGEPAGSLSCVG
jgi:flagellar secretion chaperone FliS